MDLSNAGKLRPKSAGRVYCLDRVNPSANQAIDLAGEYQR
jgi:hypothetical protein